MLKHYRQLQNQLGGKTATKMFTLRTGIQLYPILRAEGYGLHAPIAVVLEEEQMLEVIVEELRGFAEPLILPLDAKKGELCETLKKAEFELVAFFCQSRHERNLVNLSYLSQVMLSGQVDQKEFSRVIIVVFIGGVPPELADLFVGQIVLERNGWKGVIEYKQEGIRNLFGKYLDYLPMIIDTLHQIRKKDIGEKDFLLAAIEVTRFLLSKEVSEDEEELRMMRMFDLYADVMRNNWNFTADYGVWIERLRINILEIKDEISMATDRRELFETDSILDDKTLFYDENFYYIPERTFTIACGNVSYYISRMEMKHALAEAGILCGEGGRRKYFTVKIPVSTPDGIRVLGRRIRIVREWIDQPGELTWAEQIKMRRKGDVRHD